MAWCVHLHVCFPADSNEEIAKIATKHLTMLPDGCREARWFLEDMAERVGKNRGPKGGLSLWGMVGNHTDAQAFVETLRAFWTELLVGNLDSGPLDFERINVFYEPEQSEAANVYEIYFEEALVIKNHENLPFSWHQY